MNFEEVYRVQPGEKVSLANRDTKTKGPFEGKQEAVAATKQSVVPVPEKR